MISRQALLEGSIRTTHKADQLHLYAALRRVVQSTAATFRASARLDIRRGGPVLINDVRSSAWAARCAAELFGDGHLINFPPLMGSENFGDFLDCYPPLMALVGTRNEQVGAHFPHHHPQFNIDEEALPRGAAWHVLYALQTLADIESAQS